jgi:C1A family cysteine protease
MFKTILRWLVPKHIKSTEQYETKLIANTVKAKKDKRDYKCSAAVVEVPVSFIIANRPSIRNQGTIGSCASHAAIRAYEIQAKQYNTYIEGSEMFHYYVVRHEINGANDKDSGMSVRDACKGVAKYGMSIEYAWKYDIAKYNTKPSWIAYSIANLYKLDSYECCFNIEDIKKSISLGVPVICGVWLDSEYTKMMNSGIEEWKPNFKKDKGGHAQTIYGYDERYFYIDNSWGESFGKKGSYKIEITSFLKVYFDAYRLLIKKR